MFTWQDHWQAYSDWCYLALSCSVFIYLKHIFYWANSTGFLNSWNRGDRLGMKFLPTSSLSTLFLIDWHFWTYGCFLIRAQTENIFVSHSPLADHLTMTPERVRPSKYLCNCYTYSPYQDRLTGNEISMALVFQTRLPESSWKKENSNVHKNT